MAVAHVKFICPSRNPIVFETTDGATGDAVWDEVASIDMVELEWSNENGKTNMHCIIHAITNVTSVQLFR